MVGSGWSSRDQPSARISGNVALERFSLPSPTMSHVELQSKNGTMGFVCGVLCGRHTPDICGW